MKWFRAYSEMVYDRKLRRLPHTWRWLWIAVLSAASDSPIRGRLLVAEGIPVTMDDLADMAGLSTAEVERALATFTRQDMIHRDGDVLIVTHWQNRQFKSDDVTERTRAYRERSGERFKNPPEAEAENRDTEADPETEQPPRRDRARACEQTADVLVSANWINDEIGDVQAAVDRSFELVSEFNPRDGPTLAERFVRKPEYRRNPPGDWFSLWLVWLRTEIEHGRGKGANSGRTNRAGRDDPASQMGGNTPDPKRYTRGFSGAASTP